MRGFGVRPRVTLDEESTYILSGATVINTRLPWYGDWFQDDQFYFTVADGIDVTSWAMQIPSNVDYSIQRDNGYDWSTIFSRSYSSGSTFRIGEYGGGLYAGSYIVTIGVVEPNVNGSMSYTLRLTTRKIPDWVDPNPVPIPASIFLFAGSIGVLIGRKNLSGLLCKG